MERNGRQNPDLEMTTRMILGLMFLISQALLNELMNHSHALLNEKEEFKKQTDKRRLVVSGASMQIIMKKRIACRLPAAERLAYDLDLVTGIICCWRLREAAPDPRRKDPK
jgi:hypothetical protein